jgi:type II secretory pathway component GspD/PulD (secretin)
LFELLSPRTQRYVRVVERSNLLVVEAPASSLEMILGQLQQFDRPVPQVVLEAIVCVLSPQEGVTHGFDFGHALNVGDNSVLGLGLSSLAFTGSFTPWGIRNWANDFAVTSLFVRMLADEGYLTIRAAPRVMAKDGEQAEISIGRRSRPTWSSALILSGSRPASISISRQRSAATTSP